MILDFHLHSNTSPDTKLEVEEIYTEAVRKGIKYVCITNHHEFYNRLSKMGFTLTEKKLKNCLSDIKQLNLNKNTTLFFGTEIGYWQEYENPIKDFINSVQFDFVIGSVHGLPGLEVSDSRTRFKLVGRPKLQRKIVDDYFLKLKEAIKSQLFDVIGHIDIYKRIMPEPKFVNLKVQWEEIADLLIENNVGFEINTSYTNHFGKNPELAVYPSKEIIKLFVQKGVKKITIGSDTHRIEQLGNQIDDVEKYLKSLGVKQICYFEKREVKFVNL